MRTSSQMQGNEVHALGYILLWSVEDHDKKNKKYFSIRNNVNYNFTLDHEFNLDYFRYNSSNKIIIDRHSSSINHNHRSNNYINK